MLKRLKVQCFPDQWTGSFEVYASLYSVALDKTPRLLALSVLWPDDVGPKDSLCSKISSLNLSDLDYTVNSLKIRDLNGHIEVWQVTNSKAKCCLISNLVSYTLLTSTFTYVQIHQPPTDTHACVFA